MPLPFMEGAMDKQNETKLTSIGDSMATLYVATYMPVRVDLAVEFFVTEEEAMDWIETQAQARKGAGGVGRVLKREIVTDGTSVEEFDRRIRTLVESMTEALKASATEGWLAHKKFLRAKTIELAPIAMAFVVFVGLLAMHFFA